MIKSLELENFQSHRKSVLEFSEGVNAIIGSSRSGKTATLRALNWIRYNKPSGTAFNSYWNRDKKKNPKEMCQTTITFVGGKEVTRGRDSTWNGYETEPNFTFEAIGQKVPEEIEDIFNMSEVNIQKQFDTPFMLSESSAEIARFLNKTINLDKIDDVLSAAESLRRSTNKEISNKTEELENLIGSLEKFSWVGDAENKIIAIERRTGRLEVKKNEVLELEKIINSCKQFEKELLSFNIDFDSTLGVIVEVENLDLKIEAKVDKEFSLAQLINSIQAQQEALKSIPSNVEDLIWNIESYIIKEQDQKDKKKEALSLNQNIINIKNSLEEINEYDREIEKLYKEMPETCPTCGQFYKFCEGDDI